MGTLEPRWHAHVDEAWREGLFQGMELVNGADFYPAAWPWIAERKLTILANSDYHVPTRSGARSSEAGTLVVAARLDARACARRPRAPHRGRLGDDRGARRRICADSGRARWRRRPPG